jgi:hypothetical protein
MNEKMKNIFILIFALNFFFTFQIHSQNANFQAGFGMHQDIHMGLDHFIDSIMIGPNAIIDEFRPFGTISYQKRFKNKFEIEIGLSYSKTYFSYIVSIYNSTFNSYTRKVGVRVANNFNFPVNINVALTDKLYAKAGFSASFGIMGPKHQLHFINTPEINEIYNSMQDIFKRHSINYGFGGGYKIWRFDLVYFRRVSLGKMTKAIDVNNKKYEIFGKFYSNTVSLFYNFTQK